MATTDKLSPFDIISNITEKKPTLDIDVVKRDYVPWMINRGLSNIRDTVLFANEMNRYWSLDKDIQYSFLYHGIQKKKRFGKWNKVSDDTDAIELIKEFYGYSYTRAKEVLPILIDSLDEIKRLLEKGGQRKR